MLGGQVTPLCNHKQHVGLHFLRHLDHPLLANPASLWVADYVHLCGVFQVLFSGFAGVSVRPQVLDSALACISIRC